VRAMSTDEAKRANLLSFLPPGLSVRRLREGAYLAQCPFHADDSPSMNLSIKSGRWLWYCHPCGIGGDVIKFAKMLYRVEFPVACDILCGNLPRPPAAGMADRSSIAPVAKNSHVAKSSQPRCIVATYDYGMYRKVRYDPKGFSIEHRDVVTNEWEPGIGPYQTVLYIATGVNIDGPVFIVEGEKAADAVYNLGLRACAAGGANAWKPQFANQLRGHEVVILPDNDKAGERYMEAVCASLPFCAKVIRLPGLPKGGDVYDWIRAGGTKEQLLKMVADASFTKKDLLATGNS